MELKNVVVIANGSKPEAESIAEEIRHYLALHGILTDVYVTKDSDEDIQLFFHIGLGYLFQLHPVFHMGDEGG